MIAPALALVVLLAQAVPTPAPPEPMRENRAPVPVVPAPSGIPSIAGIDRTFAVAAMQGNAAELAMARLALRRSNAGEVRGFAQKMIDEHDGLMQQMQPELRRAAGSAAAAQQLAPPDALALAHLRTIAPADFDQTYLLQQVGDHLAALTAYQTEADSGTDPRLKALARTWLPTIQSHLQLALDLTRHIGGDSPFKQH